MLDIGDSTLPAEPLPVISFPVNAAELQPKSLKSALRFRDEIENRCNATIEPGQTWITTNHEYWIICPKGHRRHVIANNIIAGRGACDKCSHGPKQEKFDAFLAALTEQGCQFEP